MKKTVEAARVVHRRAAIRHPFAFDRRRGRLGLRGAGRRD
jgi:hypothetical protein